MPRPQKSLLDRAEEILNECERTDRALTVDEECEFNEILAKVRRINLADVDRYDDRVTPYRRPTPKAGPVFPLHDVGGFADDEIAGGSSRITTARYSGNNPVLAKFGDTRREAETNAYRSGMWLAAQLYGNEGAMNWCADHGLKVYAAQSEGVNTLGGNLVPTELEAAIIKNLNDYGVARQECKDSSEVAGEKQCKRIRQLSIQPPPLVPACELPVRCWSSVRDIPHSVQFIFARIAPITTINIGPASINRTSTPCLPKIVSSGSLPGANNPTRRY